MMEIIQYIIAISSAIFVLFIPGLAITFIFFKKDRINVIERLALSFVLSIATVPVLVFYFNLIGIPITTLTVSIIIFGVILISLLIIEIQSLLSNNKN